MQTAPVEIVRGYYDAFNAHAPDRAVRRLAPSMTEWGKPFGRARTAEALADIFTLFPDARLDVREVVPHGDDVVVMAACSGTHRGVGRLPLYGGRTAGVPPTGRRFSVLRIDWWSLKDGLVADRVGLGDDASLLMQLGLIPARTPFDLPVGFDGPPVVHRGIATEPRQARNLALMQGNQDAQARGDFDEAVKVFAPDTSNHGRASSLDRLKLIYGAIRDSYTRVDGGTGLLKMVAVDDGVIASTERLVRHTGVMRFPIDSGFLFELPPTGRTFVQRQIHWWTLEDGLVVSHRACRDDVGMAIQLGLLPPPPA
ncbi:ester cyclase [Phenylobacterium sp.]|uniref:nuclear transport factor 2 family protein n=1 Tax=Phenylobacterium sp. TaxID=1871053 RepID=UPI0025DB11CD|nr:ester cyclase [Phenylobacterium sp.]MBX3482236.1 ester cyclase [Phenylobacterium sp.]MCW5758414.1 ester cyclase [Phenylobacterium sp.]